MEKGIEKQSIIRIAVTGPESCGKSELAEKLARHFGTVWVPEFARSYLEKLGREYYYEDLITIARGQIRAQEDRMPQARHMIIADTELTVIKVWSDFKFGHSDPWLIEALDHQHYDLYLLCDIDLPWEPDPLREHPDRRAELLELYKLELNDRKRPWVLVSGVGSARLECALRGIENRK